MIAYHFLKDGMLAGSGEEPAWSEGETREIKGRIVLCRKGYHSSPTPWDALQYAPGPVLCLVDVPDVGKGTLADTDKYVSRSRRLIKAIDISKELRLFACDVAEEALNLEVQRGYSVDERSRAAIEVARRFAQGQATGGELDAARAAARDAAWGAAWGTARAAAWDAAWGAARDAAWAAARAAARGAQKQQFNDLAVPLFEGVAENA